MMKNSVMKNLKIIFIVVAIPVLFLSCRSEDSFPTEPQNILRGHIYTSEKIAEFDKEFLTEYINSLTNEMPVMFDIQYSVECYKITYVTPDPNGNLVTASGALFIPKGKANLSLLSLHHGTQTKRSRVGSVSSFFSPEGIIGAALGYYTLVPDYLGLGDSYLLHPYHHAETSANTVIDFIRAGREFARKEKIELNGQVFLAGYSEGGFVTLAAHREIEKFYQSEITVTASAPMAGAYDLNLTARTILQKEIYDQPSFPAYFIVAYNNIYGWNKIKSVFNYPYSDKVEALFDGTKTTGEINLQLASNLKFLFNTNFISDFLNGREPEIISAFQENSLLDWIPSAPVRFYHGSADEYVPYENSVTAKEYFTSRGAQAELITIEGGTHVSSAIPSIIDAIEWFEELKLGKILLNNKISLRKAEK